MRRLIYDFEFHFQNLIRLTEKRELVCSTSHKVFLKKHEIYFKDINHVVRTKVLIFNWTSIPNGQMPSFDSKKSRTSKIIYSNSIVLVPMETNM